jgi:hypothetical protein
MKPLYLILVTSLIIASCGHKKPLTKTIDTAKVVKVTLMPPPPLHEVEIPPPIDTNHKLSTYSAQRYFSDTVAKDKFIISLYGTNAQNGTFVLKIFNPANKLIYENICEVSDFILNYEQLKPKQQTDTVASIMKHFFDDDNFHQPALRENEKMDDDLANHSEAVRADWNEIKTDNKAISFRYRSDYKTVSSIAFSKKQQRVITVFFIW